MARDVIAGLRTEAAKDRRSTLAWLAAGPIAATGYLAMRQHFAAGFACFLAVWFAGWAARLEVGVRLAIRDLALARTPPRRAFVALIDDPNPKAMRPLLAVWTDPPAEGVRLPRPETVLRCDDEADDLECSAQDVEVHEAWVDTGPRATSKPRWVVADKGVAIPHRRAVLGRWYVGAVTRRARVHAPRPLTVSPPRSEPVRGDSPRPSGSFLRSLVWRVVGVLLLSLVALLAD